ncbi:hypothetical protein [Microbispora sp. GKU 823]|uniref:hypothetical protein n=1 Tax=Microbispora sp. GKU 823 TaxID=1652100 RepID=UPI00117D65D6|nr:hypothetical protein [Microbispora sp. GKU 823]
MSTRQFQALGPPPPAIGDGTSRRRRRTRSSNIPPAGSAANRHGLPSIGTSLSSGAKARMHRWTTSSDRRHIGSMLSAVRTTRLSRNGGTGVPPRSSAAREAACQRPTR